MKRSILSATIVSLGLAATSYAAPVYSGPLSISVPPTFDGIYLNVLTGAATLLDTGNPDYDVNPYISSTAATNWSNFNPDAAGFGSVGSSTTGPTLALPEGASIGPASILDVGVSTLTPAASFTSNAFYGFKFRNEGGASDHFGWILVSLPVPVIVGGTNAATPAGTILGYGYESTPNTAIVAGAGIPEPTSLAVLGAAAAFVLRRRRA